MASHSSFRTQDLTLASFLIYEGQDASLIRDGTTPGGRKVGAWEFEATPDLHGLIDQFESGNALVNPLKFHRLVADTRKDLFSFLGR